MTISQTRAELLTAHRMWETAASDDTTSLPSAHIQKATGPSTNAPSVSVLEEALLLTTGPRQKAYGSPGQDFTRTAGMLTSLLGLQSRPITAEEVGLIMICVKMSRQMHQRKRDNLVDIAGYVNCVDMLIQEETSV